jgi:hypothetical protein
MNRSSSPDVRKWLLVLLISSGLGSAASSGQSIGETSADAATSVGSTATKIAGAAAARPLVKTSGSALTVFAPGVYPAGLSNEGDVLLSTAAGYQRWKAGRSEALQIPDTGEFTITGMNRNGAILGSSSRNANPGFSCLSTQKGWYWAPGQSLAAEINNPFTYSGYDECANKFNDVRQFNPRVLDPANRIWADIPYEADPYFNSAFSGLHRWDTPGGSPVQVSYSAALPGAPYLELEDINSAGVMIGRRQRHGAEFAEYFVGDQAVDFYPFAINDAGQVLGYNGDSAVFRNAGSNVFLHSLYPEHMNSRGDVAGRFYDLPVLLPNSVVLGGTTEYSEHSLQKLMPAGWTPLLITGLNDAGTVTGFGFYNDPEKHDDPTQVLGFMLVPATLRVDFDRDGKIDPSDSTANPDLELSLAQFPWFFWVNDDNDAGETDGNDIPGGGDNDRDGKVNGTRDLVDFFPVHLDIAGLLKAYPASDPAITYKLTQAKGAANFMTTDLKPATAGRYHSDAAYAKELGATSVTRITAAGVNLDRTFLDKILNQNEGGIILVEAREATNQPLRLEVCRDNVPVTSLELPLSFASVETMFRHKNLVDAVNMNPVTGDRDTTTNWPDKLNNKQAFVFVHGYNVNQKQARGWQAEFFKRLWWSGSRAQFWGVTWYGSDSQKVIGSKHLTPNYHVNVVHAFGCAPRLAEFITTLRGTGDNAKIVNVAGHSLGNMVVSSAISDHSAPVTRYFMIDAAVAAEAYDSDIDGQVANASTSIPHTEWNKEFGGVYDSRLWAANWYLLFKEFPDDRRATLTWRDRFEPVNGVSYYDFYSAGEEVLDYDDKTTPSVVGILGQIAINKLSEFLHIDLPFANGQPPGHKVWQYQEQLKGRNLTNKYGGSNFGGWGFNIFDFAKRAGGYGKGPVLIPAVLLPKDANNLLESVFTKETLREEPFFRPGSNGVKIRTWIHISGKPDYKTDKLGSLYSASTGSDFASTHRNTLLARMIPAISPAAGRIPVPSLGLSNQRNFDMDDATIRPKKHGSDKPPWPSSRTTTDWWHSDLREVAYPYVRGLYFEIVKAAALKDSSL